MTGKMRVEINAIGMGKLFLDDVDVSKGCTGFDIRSRVGQIATAHVYFLTDKGVEGTIAQTDVFRHTTSERLDERRKISEAIADFAGKTNSIELKKFADSILAEE